MGRLIDADKLIEEIESYRGDIFANEIVELIKQMPSVDDTKWIPCSERLPEMHREDMEAEGEYYMISNPVLATDGNKIYVAEYEEDDGCTYGWHSLDGEDYENIIAWMPLPESYNPERSGK